MDEKPRAILAIAAAIATIIAIALAGPRIHEYFGREYTDADRHIFKESVTYNEGVLDDLAKYKFEYDTAKDDVEREAIASMVRNRFANYDKDKIENISLVNFMRECGL